MDSTVRRARLFAAASFAAVVALTGCSTGGPQNTAPTSSATRSGVATPAPTMTAPGVDESGTAADNLEVFTSVMERVWKSKNRVNGRAYIDALEKAGFDRDDMQVTHDRSTVDIAADSIQFSVLWKGECLVGQVGPSTEKPTAVVLPELPEGDCLIGNTRPIDW